MNSSEQSAIPRKTFAIISHPDAGKTTITEKLLLLGGLLQTAGTVKGKKSGKHATSDWMEMEKQRGISITTSVMQFPYRNSMVNLLDTPGHEDFSEDTYRTLTAVDSALMVIDAVKGVEDRTIKLMDVCRLRTTPIVSFINKLDRDTRDPLELMDEIESVLKIKCSPITWPIGMGKSFIGIYHIELDKVILFENGHGHHLHQYDEIQGLNNPILDERIGNMACEVREEIELVKGASYDYNHSEFLNGQLTPVYFGTALSNFGVKEMLDGFVNVAPEPLPRNTDIRAVNPSENSFSGFIFKIQANMDPQHRDRIAFMRICSGGYTPGMKMHQVRTKKNIQVSNALTFMAGSRDTALMASTGDIIGIHNHGTIQIGDTFTTGENMKFIGVPNFAPELFRRVRLKDPLKMKALLKGLIQLSEEGATQLFRPLDSNDLILGAVGILQFDVVVHRLSVEYSVKCSYEPVNVFSARWVDSENSEDLNEFRRKNSTNLALDGGGYLTYIAPTRVNLQLVQERHPTIKFNSTREH